MKLSIAASLSLFALASAQDYPGEFGAIGRWEPGSFTSSPTEQIEQLFEEAGRNPNDTVSATFPFQLGDQNPGNWTWRINISEVADPEDSSRHAVNMQWDLQWPGTPDLKTYVEDSGVNSTAGGGLCLGSVVVHLLPSNITSRYSESDQGNCSMVLGEACAEQLRQGGLSGKCNDPPPTGAYLSECEDVFPAARGNTYSTAGLVNSTFNYTIQPSDTFLFETSGLVPIENISYPYSAAETRLNILFIREIPGEGNGADAGEMLCQVVNPEARNSNAASSGIARASIWMAALVAGCGLVLL